MKSKIFRKYLLAGLVVWLPILVTYVVLRFIIDILDQTIALLPDTYQPEQLFGMHMPGLGVVLSLILLIVTGLVATNFFGQRLVGWGESLLSRIPLVRSIYNATKQVTSTIFAADSQAFRKVILVEYPRKGLWSIAFQTSTVSDSISKHVGETLISAFVPTTPNPTSGFILLVPQKEVISLNMTVDEALKFIISLAVMQPLSVATAAELKKTGGK